MEEIWKQVHGFENLYEVSNFGRIKTLHYVELSFLIPQQQGDGYLYVNLYEGEYRVRWSVHKIVLEAFIGLCPEGMECRHYPDPTKTNNRLDNISWALRSVNCLDKNEHGTMMKGENHSSSYLTEFEVLEIRRKYELGDTQKELSNEYMVAQSQISRIVNREKWKHI